MKRVVLLVDDNADDNFIHKIAIERAGIADEVIEFQYAEQALEWLAETSEPPEWIFLDINMPRMNGFEFIGAYRKLRSHRQAAHLVMLSTSFDPNDRQRATELSEIWTFLTKPLTVDLVRGLVEQVDEQAN